MGGEVSEAIEKQESIEDKSGGNVQESDISPQNPVAKPTRSKAGFWFGIIILFLVLLLAGAGFYVLQQLRDQQKDIGGEVNQGDQRVIELSKQISGYQSQLSALQTQVATLTSDLANKDEFFNKKLADFAKLHQQKLELTVEKLTKSMQQIQRQLGKTRGDWLIADAEYLLSIANQRLLLVGDLNTTKEALIAADQRLRESGDAAAFKVREEIAKEIALLNKVQVPDIVGIYSKIQLLIDNVDKLATLLPYEGKEITLSEHKQEVQEQEHTHDLLDSALIELEGLVAIRHTEQPVKAILTVEQARFLKQELRIKLEMVKLALVQQNDALFKKSITDAKTWLANNFAHNKDNDSFIKELDRLRAIQIRTQFPDVSKSLKMLRDIVKLRIETDKSLHEPEKTAPESQQQSKPQPAASDLQQGD